MRNQRGFTLVEIMVAVGVLAVLLVVGVGSFREVTRNSRVRAQANKVVSAMNLARSEALKRSLPVTVCPSADGADCDGATDWAGNLIVFVDRETAGAVDDDDLLVQQFDASSPGITVDSSEDFVQFTGSGLTNLAAAATVDIHHEDCTGTGARRINISVAGRSASSAVECP